MPCLARLDPNWPVMDFQLAQINIGRLRSPVDSPDIAEFAANLDRINALAEALPGFVWRLTGAGNNATDISAFADPLMAINMSVWIDAQSLAGFVYRSGHRNSMRKRSLWFEKLELFMCLWWVPAGHRPTPQEGIERLDILRQRGPSQDAFTFREPFPAPNAVVAPQPILDRCA